MLHLGQFGHVITNNVHVFADVELNLGKVERDFDEFERNVDDIAN